mmetsp:Transcript_12136/g.22728  ORF Transcript_12136/g.22728 Transcript_12136/m.22728 type:complete len:185 (+) Transcript_12136:26-580(+)
MNIDSDSEDEFFGCQSDNDTEASHLRNNQISTGVDDDSDDLVKGALVVGAIAAPSPIAVDHSHGTLSLQESMAQDQVYKNIGYHQAYDRCKEVKLQEGFEAGYRTYIDDAMRLGDLLGKQIMMAMMTNETSSYDSRKVSSVITNIKNYLMQSQSESTTHNQNANNDQQDKELHDILNMVHSDKR